MGLPQVTVPFIDSYNYGVGADLATGSPKNVPVMGAIESVPDASGSVSGYKITRISTTEELESQLDIDAEASYGSATFGAGVSARFKFAKKCKIQSSSLFLAVTANIKLTHHSIKIPTLTPEAELVVNRSDVFSERYGNMFVRGIGRGGLFVGVIQVNTSSEEESKDIFGSINGAYGLFSAEVETTFKELQKKYKSDITAAGYFEGGPGNLIPDDINKPDQLVDLLRTWLNAFKNHPNESAWPYYAVLAPITIANGPIPPNIVDIQKAQDVLVICAKKRSSILNGLNLMEYISDNSERYDFVAPTTPASIVKASNGYQSDLDTVAAAASQAINDVTKALTPANYAKANGITFPQGELPDPMPTLKKGEKKVPNFVGLTYKAALSLSQELGIPFTEFEPSGPDDIIDYQQEYLRALSLGWIDQDNIVQYHPHSNDQIVITWQQQPAGTFLEPDSTVIVTFDLAPGVPP